MGYKLSIRKKQLLIIIHVLSVVCWLGGAMVMLLLGMYMLKAENGEQLYYTLDNMHLVDVVFIRYTAVVALLLRHCLVRLDELGAFQALLDLD